MDEGTTDQITQAGETLEELVEPLSGADAAEPLAVGAVLSSAAGDINIVNQQQASRSINRYLAELDRDGTEICLFEARDAGAIARLRRQATALSDASCTMFPQVVAAFEQDGTSYLAVGVADGRTLADLLRTESPDFAAALPIITQAAFALTRLHAAGWAHLGIKPSAISASRPVKVTGLSHVAKVGEDREVAFYYAGYSAPELLNAGPADARSDVYSIGALLFHAATGHAIPETGPELTSWQSTTPIPGLPQLLHRCLGPIEQRYGSMEELHRDLICLARRLTPRVQHVVSSATTIGIEPTRTTNQDAHGFLSGKLETDSDAQSWSVVVVADGMGGMAAGEVASALAVRSVLADAAAAFGDTGPMTQDAQVSLPKKWITKANSEIHRMLEGRGAKGGCTLVCACVMNNRLTIGHVGDCRIYLLRGDCATLLTRDHSLVMGRVLQGELDIAEIRTHPERSSVTRSLGERESLPDYYVDNLTATSDSPTLELKPGDVILLATDGLWEPVIEDEMLAAVTAATIPLASPAKSLIALALTRGAPDNATVALLNII